MWVLFVINTVVAKDEIKYTRYAEYGTELECVTEAIDLYYEFKENEEAICEYE